MKIVPLKRKSRAQVIANFIASGMAYTQAIREYDRLDQQDFLHRFRYILNDG
jgi:hypothetical protein